MTNADVAIQSLVPPALAKWVQSRAKRDGVSVSAWVRALIERERAQVVVGAWWWSPARLRARDSVAAFLAAGNPPVYLLERISRADAGAWEFRVLTAAGRPIAPEALVNGTLGIGPELYAGAFVLNGDPARVWSVQHSTADGAGARSWRVTLAPRPFPAQPEA